jgi:hypothetical protein
MRTATLIKGYWFAWLLAGLFPALLAGRFLYADGAAYLIEIATSGHFNFPWNGRQVAQVLDQWPAVLALWAGVRDLRFVTYALGCGMMLMPVLLHGIGLMLLIRAGWSLPATVYTIMWFLLAIFTNLMSVAESHVSAAVCCLGLVVAVSGRPAGLSGWLVLGVIALMSFALYEFWFFYAALLCLILINRLWFDWNKAGGFEKVTASFVVLLMTGSSTVNLLRLLGSSDNPNRNSFLDMLYGTTMPIYLLLIGGWFGFLCLHLFLLSRPELSMSRFLPREKVRTVLLVTSLLLLMVVSAIQHPTMVRYSYPFRVLNLMLPLLFGVWLWLGRGRLDQPAPPVLRPVLIILLAFLLIYETRSTWGWRKYMAWEANVEPIVGGGLFVPNPPHNTLAQIWIYPWTQPAVSFLAQALNDGQFRAIGYDPSVVFQPYGPGYENEWRLFSKRFGIKLSGNPDKGR